MPLGPPNLQEQPRLFLTLTPTVLVFDVVLNRCFVNALINEAFVETTKLVAARQISIEFLKQACLSYIFACSRTTINDHAVNVISVDY